MNKSVNNNINNYIMIGITIQKNAPKINNIMEVHNVKNKIKVKYPTKSNYNCVIPLNIFQTWHSKLLPIRMSRNIVSLRKNNPKFKYYLFDDKDCEQFIKNNFDQNVLNAFNSLVPGAYKADLWRYCILYKKGGIYLDIKYGHLNHFKLINLTESEHWVLDTDRNGIYNALIVCKPGNEKCWQAICQIVENVKNRYYGRSKLDPTGPYLLSRIFTKEEKQAMDMSHEYYLGDLNNRVILFNNIPVLRSYNGYLQDHKMFKKTDHYSNLWNSRQIYR